MARPLELDMMTADEIPVLLGELPEGYGGNSGSVKISVRSQMAFAVDKVYIYAHDSVTDSNSKVVDNKNNPIPNELEVIVKEDFMDLQGDLYMFKSHVIKCIELKQDTRSLEIIGGVCFEYSRNFRII